MEECASEVCLLNSIAHIHFDCMKWNLCQTFKKTQPSDKARTMVTGMFFAVFRTHLHGFDHRFVTDGTSGSLSLHRHSCHTQLSSHLFRNISMVLSVNCRTS